MNDRTYMADDEIIRSCISGDARAQKFLFDTYSRRMMGLCMRYASGREEAEDMLQEGWIKVFRNLHQFRFEGSAEGWIKKVMINTCLELLRRNKKMSNHLGVEAAEQIAVSEFNSNDTLSAKDLMNMIHKLPSGYRTVFNLYAIEGYTHKEIGEKLGINENTSKSQYSRARAHLQKMLELENV
ncbi:MAG TPA: sigma-70 family RNA polymerase sigma factor [Bacteroidia bacterium]|nr:sigma-70 family RNA polymerase sigma factor [Bacteroidia bacterium]